MIQKDLFTHSNFFIVDKQLPASPEQVHWLQHHKDLYAVSHMQSERQREYLLGRFCATQAYRLCTGQDLSELPTLADRSPRWPQAVVGSLAHNQRYVIAVVALQSVLCGVGVDIEQTSRPKPQLRARICNDKDLITHPDFSDQQLLALIFSAKESLYKALYPSVKQFFGFEAAALTSVDRTRSAFTMQLLQDLRSPFLLEQRFEIHGRYQFVEDSVLTVIEVVG